MEKMRSERISEEKEFPRVLVIPDLTNPSAKSYYYAYKLLGRNIIGICLSCDRFKEDVGEYATFYGSGHVEYKGVMLEEWQKIIDNYELGEKIANSTEPIADYLAQRGDKLREEKRVMETDSEEPFTVTEKKGSECVNEMLSGIGIDYLAEIERLGMIIAEQTQFIEDLEGEHQFLAEENQDQRAVIKYLELKLAEK